MIPISQPSITSREIEYVTDAIKSGWVSSLGEYIIRFENEFAEFCGVEYALTTSNGTAALHLSLIALGIEEGDEVIIPDFTFIATANAVKYTGAVPVMVDVDPLNLCIDPACIEAAITDRTKAIIPVHLFGHPADMTVINKIADENDLLVIEDAAEAIGASINSKRVGGFGLCGTFSFYGNKIITTGEGGMITTNDKEFYERCMFLRDHAMSKDKRYWHDEIGYNYRITNLQAALGCAQMSRITELIGRRKEIYQVYQECLMEVNEVSLNRTYDWADNVFWQIAIEVEGYSEIDRDALMVQLREKGVDSRPYFYPMSDMPMYDEVDTPITHDVSKRGICLPSYFDLQDEQIEEIVEILKKNL